MNYSALILVHHHLPYNYVCTASCVPPQYTHTNTTCPPTASALSARMSTSGASLPSAKAWELEEFLWIFFLVSRDELGSKKSEFDEDLVEWWFQFHPGPLSSYSCSFSSSSFTALTSSLMRKVILSKTTVKISTVIDDLSQLCLYFGNEYLDRSRKLSIITVFFWPKWPKWSPNVCLPW